jgi:hypothetical protein
MVTPIERIRECDTGGNGSRAFEQVTPAYCFASLFLYLFY